METHQTEMVERGVNTECPTPQAEHRAFGTQTIVFEDTPLLQDQPFGLDRVELPNQSMGTQTEDSGTLSVPSESTLTQPIEHLNCSMATDTAAFEEAAEQPELHNCSMVTEQNELCNQSMGTKSVNFNERSMITDPPELHSRSMITGQLELENRSMGTETVDLHERSMITEHPELHNRSMTTEQPELHNRSMATVQIELHDRSMETEQTEMVEAGVNTEWDMNAFSADDTILASLKTGFVFNKTVMQPPAQTPAKTPAKVMHISNGR